jgi:hypothetical protein
VRRVADRTELRSRLRPGENPPSSVEMGPMPADQIDISSVGYRATLPDPRLALDYAAAAAPPPPLCRPGLCPAAARAPGQTPAWPLGNRRAERDDRYPERAWLVADDKTSTRKICGEVLGMSPAPHATCVNAAPSARFKASFDGHRRVRADNRKNAELRPRPRAYVYADGCSCFDRR